MAERDGVQIAEIEITTCMRRGEIEVVTRYKPAQRNIYDAFAATLADRHHDTLFSSDGATVDQQVAALLRGEDSAQRARSPLPSPAPVGWLRVA